MIETHTTATYTQILHITIHVKIFLFCHSTQPPSMVWAVVGPQATKLFNVSSCQKGGSND